MKHKFCIATMVLAATALLAAEPKTEVQNAAKKLADTGNYSWRTVSESADGRGRMGPTEGKVDKDGTIFMTVQRSQSTQEVVLKGDKGAMKVDDEWRSLSEVAEDDSEDNRRNRFYVALLKAFKAPAAEATDLLSKMSSVKKDGDTFSGELTPEGIKAMLGRWRPPGGNPPEIKGPSGSVRFWLTDGQLTKYEQKIKATVTFNDNDLEIDRTTTTEIKEVGKTKVEVPEAAKKKL